MEMVKDFNIAGKMKYSWMKPIGYLQAQGLLGDGLENSEFSIFYEGVSWYFSYDNIPNIARALILLQLCGGEKWWEDIRKMKRVLSKEGLPDILSPHDKSFVVTCFIDQQFDRLKYKIKNLETETFEKAALKQHPDLEHLLKML